MDDYQNTPSIIDREITSFRGGQRLAYRDLTGREKRDYLFDAGIWATAYANEPGGSRPDVRQALLQFTASALNSIAHHLLAETVTRSSDELETPKPKLFHSSGTQARGLARFSYAGPVVGIGVVPSLGLKFPVDGDRSSENAVVMRMLDPQSQHSVFENAFTNILPVPRFTNLVMRAVKARFETVVVERRGRHQPVENLARVHPSGLPVDGAVRAPYRVIFVPTEAARQASNPALDFQDDLAQNIPRVGRPSTRCSPSTRPVRRRCSRQVRQTSTGSSRMRRGSAPSPRSQSSSPRNTGTADCSSSTVMSSCARSCGRKGGDEPS